MSCCTSILDIGCYEACDTLQIFTNGATGTAVTAVQAGVHTFLLTNTMREVGQATYAIGDPIAFTNVFNEDMTSTFMIRQPDGTDFMVGTNDCFKVLISVPSDPALADTGVDCGVVTVKSGCDSSDITTVSCPGTYFVPCITDINGGDAVTVPPALGVIDGGSA